MVGAPFSFGLAALDRQARSIEQARQKATDDANKRLEAERQRHARIAAGLRDDVGVLRDGIRAFVASEPAPESCAAERERAATLGGLLGDAVRTAADATAAAERHAAEVRALLRAWPD